MPEPDFEIEVAPQRDRLHVTIVRGRYANSFDVSTAEAEALIEVLHDALTNRNRRTS